ncbi:MAG TPA: hypothetical protein VFV19_11515 [Candidatus Polarisedimenticolaceae bacterium]|nr:hypothetical protein [Candidatus Polarisedimenticolaceae bacterium]
MSAEDFSQARVRHEWVEYLQEPAHDAIVTPPDLRLGDDQPRNELMPHLIVWDHHQIAFRFHCHDARALYEELPDGERPAIEIEAGEVAGMQRFASPLAFRSAAGRYSRQ